MPGKCYKPHALDVNGVSGQDFERCMLLARLYKEMYAELRPKVPYSGYIQWSSLEILHPVDFGGYLATLVGD